MKKLMVFLVCVLVSTTIFAQNEFEKRMNNFEKKVVVGELCPEVTVQDLTGESINFQNLKGKVILVNFFFIECAPCLMEIPHLEQLYQKYQDSVVFVAISRWNTAQEIKTKILNKNTWSFKIIPSLTGKNDQNQSDNIALCEGTFAVPLYPTNLIIDKNGAIFYKQVGYTKENIVALESKIKEVLLK